MPTAIRNTSVNDAHAPLDVPHRTDGAPYRFEMVYDAFTKRAYADTAEDLLGALIAGYEALVPQDRLAARIKWTVRVQVVLQAAINDVHRDLVLSAAEREVAYGHRNVPPAITTWDSDLPLVLVDHYYAPVGDLPRPGRQDQDVAQADNVIWLSPVDPYDLLESLHHAGVIALNRHTGATP